MRTDRRQYRRMATKRQQTFVNSTTATHVYPSSAVMSKFLFATDDMAHLFALTYATRFHETMSTPSSKPKDVVGVERRYMEASLFDKMKSRDSLRSWDVVEFRLVHELG
jgi:hypothetical protein